MKQTEDDQRLFDEAVSNRRSEAESVQRAIQRQQEIYTRQQCLFEEENRRYETQLKDLHGQVQEAQRNYEMLLKDGEADQQQIVAAQEAYQKLKNAYQELFNRPLSSCPTKKEKTMN
jgi:chromosome segregation ATPase